MVLNLFDVFENLITPKSVEKSVQKIFQNLSRLYLSLCLLSWSHGGQECLDGWLLVVPRDPVDLVEH